jgi:hypothetical protein
VVLLERVVVEVLRAVGEVRARDTRRRALSREVVVDADLPAPRAEAAGDPVELGILADCRPVCGEVPRVLREVLERYVLELRALVDEELDRAVRVAARTRRVLLDEREAAVLLGDDEEPPEARAATTRRCAP